MQNDVADDLHSITAMVVGGKVGEACQCTSFTGLRAQQSMRGGAMQQHMVLLCITSATFRGLHCSQGCLALHKSFVVQHKTPAKIVYL